MSAAPGWRAPEPLTTAHQVIDFDCGEPTLNLWLQRRALRNEDHGASRTYVLCRGQQVVAYYCLSTGSVMSEVVPGRIRRNMPDPIPVLILGRLAVTLSWQNHGLGKALLRDAILRTLGVAELVGVKALMVHALSEVAANFYLEHGFYASPRQRLTLFLPLAEALDSL